eukprot:3040695-Ditylum_brightwellii.AAC.1
MGWQKKGSSHTYDSISGHAFMSRARARMILACMICCKLCGVCSVAEKLERNLRNTNAVKMTREAAREWKYLQH